MTEPFDEDGDWYFVDRDEDKELFNRTIYEDLMASQGVRIDKHGNPLEWTDRTVAVNHLATWVAKRYQLRGKAG